jgi:hypothetical protein
MFQIQKTESFWISMILAAVAGIIYCSWPLGYWLNPAVSRTGLASELEGLHQPYNWVFISLDIISGIIVSVIAIMLWKRNRDLVYKTVLVNFALFGIFTLIDALLPMTCEPSLQKCPSLSHQPLLILHGIASILASVCLFISAVLVWWVKRQHRGSSVMSTLMAGWALFGIFSLYFFFEPGPGYLAQHYYITLCSVWVMLFPLMVTPDAKRLTKKLKRAVAA